MANHPSSRHRFWLYFNMLLFTLLAALTNVLAKGVVSEHSPYFVAFWRFTLAMPGLWVLMRISKKTILLFPMDRWRFVMLALLVVPGNQLLFLIGIQYAPAAHAGLLYGTTPVWVLLMALGLRLERLRWWKVVGIGLAIIGVLIVLAGRGLAFSILDIKGDAILLLAVLAWSAYTALGKPLVERYGPLEVTFLVMTFGGLMYLPFGLPAAVLTDYSSVSPADWGAVLYLGFITSGLVYFLWYWLVNYLRPTQVAVVTCGIPVATSLLAWVILGEGLTPYFASGGLITLAGIAITVIVGGEKHAQDGPPGQVTKGIDA